MKVEVEVDLDGFDDDEILWAAACVIESQLKRPAGPEATCRAPVEHIRKAFAEATCEVCETSSAARLASYAELRALVEGSDGFYRFAGAKQ